MNLHPYTKNQAIASFCSGDLVNLKVLEFDWLRAFWPTSQDPGYSQIWDRICAGT